MSQGGEAQEVRTQALFRVVEAEGQEGIFAPFPENFPGKTPPPLTPLLLPHKVTILSLETEEAPGLALIMARREETPPPLALPQSVAVLERRV